MAGISTVEMPDDSGWSSPPFPSTVLLDENVGTRTSLDVDSLALSLRVGAAHPILELFSTPLMEQIVPWGSMDVSFSSGWGFNAWKTLVNTIGNSNSKGWTCESQDGVRCKTCNGDGKFDCGWCE